MRSSHWVGSSAATAVATTNAKARQLQLLGTLRIVVHVLGCFVRPGLHSGSSRLARHQRGEEITSINRRGKLTMSDDIVSQLSRRNDGSAWIALWDHVAGTRVHDCDAVSAASDVGSTRQCRGR